MAFHVACPITCRSICFCTLGFPQKLQSDKGRKDFLQEVVKIEEFLRDPWSLRVKEEPTVQVLVPRIEPPPPAPVPVVNSALGDGIAVPSGAASVSGVVGGDGYNVDAEELLSGHSKRTALQKKGENDSKAAEDYARRFESGVLLDISGEIVEDLVGEAQAVKVMCRICCDGEKEGSERALRMLPCKICNRRYHASCLKVWGQHRDLFHLSSWTCPLCRTCEVCRRSGDPKKFMFCKRCDGAYHCYCQQPPHKNVSTGPYLCSKHTRCHSCGSNVPGNGLSTRWFLGYTCCDACGRLFNKGNYCPVCLKVYRDSESTPMVCCDDCQRWVHCQCDGISDEKYYQFQADGNLHYTCPACRGECYQIEGHDDAIRELWKRRDRADRNQIAIFRAAAGLPSEENAFSVSIYSDDDEHSPAVPKHEHGRSLKFSVKGSAHKSAKNKDYGKLSNKKYGKKKGYQVSLVGDIQSDRSEGQEMMLSPAATTHGNAGEKCSVNQAGIVKHDFVEEDLLNREDRSHRVVQIKNNKSPGPDLGDGLGKHTGKSDSVKGKKLVIHLGSRNRNTTNSPRSEASSGNKEQELTASNGERLSSANQSKGAKYSGLEGASIKLGKVNSEVSELNPQTGRRNFIVGSMAIGKTRVLPGGKEGIAAASDPLTPAASLSNEEVPLRRHSKGILDIGSRVQENNKSTTSGYDPLPNDPKPLLKLKFKNPYLDNRNTFVPQTEEEKTTIKGQRSKRKRPSSFEQNHVREDEDMAQIGKDNSVNEVMDANWILKKLGKEAIGKKVEVHQPSDSSWHKGVVTDAIEGTSTLAVRLDDGRNRMLELGKQAVRFVPQKRSRT